MHSPGLDNDLDWPCYAYNKASVASYVELIIYIFTTVSQQQIPALHFEEFGLCED